MNSDKDKHGGDGRMPEPHPFPQLTWPGLSSYGRVAGLPTDDAIDRDDNIDAQVDSPETHTSATKKAAPSIKVELEKLKAELEVNYHLEKSVRLRKLVNSFPNRIIPEEEGRKFQQQEDVERTKHCVLAKEILRSVRNQHYSQEFVNSKQADQTPTRVSRKQPTSRATSPDKTQSSLKQASSKRRDPFEVNAKFPPPRPHNHLATDKMSGSSNDSSNKNNVTTKQDAQLHHLGGFTRDQVMTTFRYVFNVLDKKREHMDNMQIEMNELKEQIMRLQSTDHTNNDLASRIVTLEHHVSGLDKAGVARTTDESVVEAIIKLMDEIRELKMQVRGTQDGLVTLRKHEADKEPTHLTLHNKLATIEKVLGIDITMMALTPQNVLAVLHKRLWTIEQYLHQKDPTCTANKTFESLAESTNTFNGPTNTNPISNHHTEDHNSTQGYCYFSGSSPAYNGSAENQSQLAEGSFMPRSIQATHPSHGTKGQVANVQHNNPQDRRFCSNLISPVPNSTAGFNFSYDDNTRGAEDHGVPISRDYPSGFTQILRLQAGLPAVPRASAMPNLLETHTDVYNGLNDASISTDRQMDLGSFMLDSSVGALMSGGSFSLNDQHMSPQPFSFKPNAGTYNVEAPYVPISSQSFTQSSTIEANAALSDHAMGACMPSNSQSTPQEFIMAAKANTSQELVAARIPGDSPITTKAFSFDADTDRSQQLEVACIPSASNITPMVSRCDTGAALSKDSQDTSLLDDSQTASRASASFPNSQSKQVDQRLSWATIAGSGMLGQDGKEGRFDAVEDKLDEGRKALFNMKPGDFAGRKFEKLEGLGQTPK